MNAIKSLDSLTPVRNLWAVLVLAGLGLSGPAAALTFTVNSTGDSAVILLDGQCATSHEIAGVPECTLRAALQEAAHAPPGTVNIHFDIAACPDALCVIEIDTAAGESLPLISSPVVIDGSTQPGNEPVCQLGIADRVAYRVALQGNGGTQVHGLELTAGSDGSRIRGLNIRHFEHGIALIGSHDNRVECNAIGTDSSGQWPGPGNLSAGVFLACDSSGNVIGGADPEQANLIAANGIDGVQLFGGFLCGDQPEDNMPVNNAVLGNRIGVAADGISPLGNLWAGIAIFGGPGADHNLIGVLQDRESIRGNVIGFNGTAGLYIDSDGLQYKPTEHTLVVGNFFGTDRTGLLNLGNQLGGIDIIRGALTTIGGTGAGEANVFAFNDDGVYMERQISDRNHVQRNSMYANTRYGIFLEDDHEFDPPGTGPNRLQAAPILSSSFTENGVISVEYSVPEPLEHFPLIIEFFRADGDREQGRVFLAQDDYPEPGSRIFTFNSALIDPAQYLVATATDNQGNTSRFSVVIELLDGAPIKEDSIFKDRFE